MVYLVHAESAGRPAIEHHVPAEPLARRHNRVGNLQRIVGWTLAEKLAPIRLPEAWCGPA